LAAAYAAGVLRLAVGRRWRRFAGELVQRSWERARSLGALHPESVRAARFGHLGRGSLIGFPNTALFGERWMHIGDETLIGPWVTLTAGYMPDQPDVPDRALVIGDRCVIGARSSIIAHSSITIGDDVWFGEDVFVTDANHGYEDPTLPIGRQIADAEPVAIGAGSWLGHGAIVLPGADVGRHVVVAAGSVVRGVVPESCVVAGSPARVVRRRCSDGQWRRVARTGGTTDEVPGDGPPTLLE
jgi:acetyltransferase-like isoleucine patch superfamily enzyme